MLIKYIKKIVLLAPAAALLLTAGALGLEGVVVSNLSQLKTAVSNANSGGDKNIVVTAGAIELDNMLHITANGVTVRGQTGNRGDVTIKGRGMGGSVPHVFLVRGSNVTIRDMTIGWVANHGVQIQGEQNANGTLLSNLHIVDCYEQMVKISFAAGSPACSQNGVMENCLLEYSAGIGPNWYIGGIDGHQTKNWIVRGNVFKHIISPGGDVAEHAVHFWSNAENTLVENNIIINCDRGIGFGLGSRGHIGGTIRNNMIYHNSEDNFFADVGIGLENASNVEVYNNTVFMENSYSNAVEYRFTGTQGGVIANNLVNKNITSRNGGTANVYSNLSNAAASWFVNPSTGNLHLQYAVAAAVDQGSAIAGLTGDIDGDNRPLGGAVDIGADEYRPAPANPDFNGDGNVDILWRYDAAGGGQNLTWHMDGLLPDGTASLPRVNNLDWRIEGTGDFNNDGHTDILWRNYGSDANGGKNTVWYLDGVSLTQTAAIPRVNDPDWHIEGTGDFNNDGHRDILWRNYGSGANGGKNVVWFMDGVNLGRAAVIPRVKDTGWYIEGTGDFNNDGHTDILWRNYGSGANVGKNVIWFMDGVSRTQVTAIPRVKDTNWRIEATGDFNNDGNTDILWRNYSGGRVLAWCMDGVTPVEMPTISRIRNPDWKICN